MADDEDSQYPARPGRSIGRDGFQCNEERKSPYLRDKTHEEAVVDFFRDPGPEKELNDEYDVSGDLFAISQDVQREAMWRVLTVSKLVSNVPNPNDRS